MKANANYAGCRASTRRSTSSVQNGGTIATGENAVPGHRLRFDQPERFHRGDRQRQQRTDRSLSSPIARR